MTRVEVSEEILRWAMDTSGRERAQLDSRFPIAKWLTGERKPTFRQLERFAAFTRVPFGYLFLDTPPAERLPIPFFRTLGDQQLSEPSTDLLETVQMLLRRQHWIREYLQGQDYNPLSFVGAMSMDEKEGRAAQFLRETLQLPRDWAKDCPTWKDALRELRRAMDASGVFVVVNGVVGNNTHRRLDPGEFRGFVLVDQYAPFVFVNGADTKAAQMFTLAHELAHIVFGHSGIFDLHALQPADDRVEKVCNRVAAEFLVPADDLKEIWPEVRGATDPFQSLARQFKVSPIVVARRLLDLQFIDQGQFFQFYNKYMLRFAEVPQREEGGGSHYNNQNVRVGQRFFAHVLRALHAGDLTYTEAYRLTGLRGETFRQYAEMVTGGGAL